MKTVIEKLACKARNSIGKFCYEECNAYCCRKGSIRITTEQASLITGSKFKGYQNSGNLSKTNNGFELKLSGGCPALSGFKCSIHKNPKRPDICRDFPVFVEEDRIVISDRCYGKDKLYPYISMFKKYGYKVEFA